MSQIIKFTATSGPGSGSVTSISAGTGITLTPNPITTTGTVALTVPVVVANGGTGATTLTNHGVLLGQGTAAIAATAVGTTGQVLTGVTGADPIWSSPASSSISLTGDSGGALTGTAFTITGGTSGLVFAGSGTTLTGSFNSLFLPATTAGGNGIIYQNSIRFMHSFATSGGTTNTFLGYTAGNLTMTAAAVDNAGVGFSALLALTSGRRNATCGSLAGKAITSGGDNTAIGYNALAAASGGASNTAVGSGCLGAATGNFNTAMGNSALGSLGAGSNNIGIGFNAGSAYTAAESSNIAIRNSGVAAESNALRIGTSGSGTAQQNKCFIAGIDGINIGSVAKVVAMSATGEQLGTTTITAGSGVTVTPGANTITLAVSSFVPLTAFTPTIEFGGASVGIVYAQQTGFYMRIGSAVYISIQVGFTNKGSSVGNATLSGLPLATTASLTIALPVASQNLTFAGIPIAYTGGTTTLNIANYTSAGGFTLLTNTAFANNTFLFITGWYNV